jgi:signal peptidase I
MAESYFSQLSADLLRHGHSVRFRATGESMHPTIRAGDAITVQPVVPSDLRYADIMLYRTERSVLAHRVVGRLKAAGARGAFLVRGDACMDCDEPVAEAQVLGKVVTVERGDRLIALDRRTAKIWHLVRLFVYRLKRGGEHLGR